MRWTLLVDPRGRTGADNMGIDAALLHAAREDRAFLRIYCWRPACLSFGRNEPARTRYDVDRIRRLSLDTVRRPTGGRAVWHDAEVTYAVAAPVQSFGGLRDTFLAIHEVVAEAVRALGADARLAAGGRASPVGAGACFAAPVGGEVVIGHRKLVGSAQVRHGGAFLQHGSILLRDDQGILAQITRGAAPETAATSLRATLGRPVAFADVARVLATAAQRTWAGEWTTSDAPPPPEPVFDDPAWTWRR